MTCNLSPVAMIDLINCRPHLTLQLWESFMSAYFQGFGGQVLILKKILKGSMCSPYEFPENLWRPLNPPWLGMSVKPSEFAWCTNCTLDMSNFPWCCHHAIRSRRPVSSQLSLCDVQIVHFEIGVCTNKVHRQCVTHISKFSNPWCLLTFQRQVSRVVWMYKLYKMYTWHTLNEQIVHLMPRYETGCQLCVSATCWCFSVNFPIGSTMWNPQDVHIVKFRLGCF